MEILPNIHQIDGGGVNAYLIYEPGGLTLIDTAYIGTVDKILSLIRALGREPTDVKHILLTHRHPDHVGGAANLRQVTHAKVWAPQPDAKAISEDPSATFPVAPLGTMMRLVGGKSSTPLPCAVDETLLDGTMLPVLGGLKVVWTPGHTHGHCSLYHPEQQILFAGDAVMTFGGKVRPTFPFLCDSYEESCRSIRDHLAPIPTKHVLAGHGKPLQKDVPQHFERLARRFAGM
ncbi:MAG: MBL fold metallo-hydrolase [Herpetosiphonaceae bacterium]|nr:MBL fold metallo-hydrolase [Herpetosiphonaceae bacterium]